MYIETDRHCRECICPSCDKHQTRECLEDADFCDHCDNTEHVSYCPWHPDEQ